MSGELSLDFSCYFNFCNCFLSGLSLSDIILCSMREQNSVGDPDTQNYRIVIIKIVVPVIYPRGKCILKLFGNGTVFFFAEPTEVYPISMRSKPFTCNSNDRIVPDLPHFV